MVDPYEDRREEMVVEQLQKRGIGDTRVLGAMRRVPRHAFVPIEEISEAYKDTALPIGFEATISQPLMVATMTQLLEIKGGEKTLEIGAGSGYQAAILSEMGANVIAVERIPPLVSLARENCRKQGYDVKVFGGDGTRGWPPLAPYDRIVFTASPPLLPRPYLEQLAPGGRIVGPIGSRDVQELMVFRKLPSGGVEEERHGGCIFIPMIGQYGWPED